jgi:hypothetical protein
MKVQENQVGLKLNGTNQLLAYADDVNLLGDNIDTIEKNTETLIDASKEVGLEINVAKAKYMFLFSSSDVIATICFDHTIIIRRQTVVYSRKRFCLTVIAVSWISNHELWLPWESRIGVTVTHATGSNTTVTKMHDSIVNHNS